MKTSIKNQKDGYIAHLHSQLFQWQMLCYNNKIKIKDVSRGISKGCKTNSYYSFERKARNQQIIGTTALAYIEKLLPDNDDKLMQVISIFNHQSVDGSIISV